MRATPSARTGVKAAVVSAGAVVLLSSGVAVAATGHAPWQATDAPAAAGTTTASDAPADDGTATGTPATQGFRGLCRAYLSGNKAVHGQALRSPAFAALVTAAGGLDGVAALCASTGAGAPPDPAHPGQASPPAHAAPPSHPVSGPASDPTQPTDSGHPTHPVHPAHPSHPAHPTHPTHPTHGANASHPPHPTHPVHPSHPTHGPDGTHPPHPTHS